MEICCKVVGKGYEKFRREEKQVAITRPSHQYQIQYVQFIPSCIPQTPNSPKSSPAQWYHKTNAIIAKPRNPTPAKLESHLLVVPLLVWDAEGAAPVFVAGACAAYTGAFLSVFPSPPSYTFPLPSYGV